MEENIVFILKTNENKEMGALFLSCQKVCREGNQPNNPMKRFINSINGPFSPTGRDRTQNQCVSIRLLHMCGRKFSEFGGLRAGVDIHIALLGGHVAHTLRVWAVMVRNSAGVSCSSVYLFEEFSNSPL